MFRVYFVKNILKTNHLDTRQQPDRGRNTVDRFGDSQVTVRNVLCQSNNSSAMSIITVDNTLTTQSGVKVKEENSSKQTIPKFHVKPKKRKRNILTNCCKKKFKFPSNISVIAYNVVTKEVTEYSYDNCLVK